MTTTLERAIFIRTSSLVVQKVYPNVLPQTAALPAISYQIVDSSTLKSLQGSVGVTRARVQFTCYSLVLKDVEEMLETLRHIWEGYCSAEYENIEDLQIISSYVEGEPVDMDYKEAGDDEVTYQGGFDIGYLYYSPITEFPIS